jgi:phenylacetate-CoA ligase
MTSFVAPQDSETVTELLRAQLEGLPARSPLYRDLFAEHGVGAAAFASLDDLRKFPFTTKQMLRDSQAAAPPLGRHAGVGMTEVIRVHASTGTTGKPSWVGVTRRDAAAWTDMVARAFRTMGASREDVVLHGAGLTLFVGGLPIRDALERIGATMVPIGTGASDKAVLALETLGVTALHSTPSYARYLAEHLRALGRDPKEFGLAKILVGGEPGGGEPEFRRHVEQEWGAPVTEGLGNADMAPVIFAEAPGSGGMRFTGGRHVLVELIDPDSGEPISAEAGATGELVYTSVDRECCPLVRFRTRDRVRVTGIAPDGAPLIRCTGRTDDMLIVLGVNVFPSALRDLVQRLHPRTTGAMQVVLPAPGPRVEPPLRVEVEVGEQPGDREQLARELEGQIRSRLSVRAEVVLVPAGSIERSEMKSRLTRIAD